MALKVSTKKEKVRVPYIVDGEEEAVFYVIPIGTHETNNLIKKHSMVIWDAPSKKTKKERFKETDYISVNWERFNRSVVDWEGVTDEDGNELPCNTDTKALIFDSDIDLVNWILREADNITSLEQDKKEELEKNYEAGLSGTPLQE